MFLLLAELTPTPGATAEVEQILTRLAGHAKSEPGNLAYALHRPQGAGDAIVLTEIYADRAACDAHLASAPVRDALARFESVLACAPRITFCDTIAGHARAFVMK